MLEKSRQQFLTLWQRQNNAQRLILVGLLAGSLLVAGVFVLWANNPSYSVAFSGLEEADAGQIVAKLDELGISYQIKAGGTILVPSKEVYSVRLKMANEDLPQSGNVGFELFSGNTLGMTEFTQRVNYQRAMEGELERTIGSLASIEAVRVHIVTPEKTLLSDEQLPTTASITVQEKKGARIDAAQVRAITHLVASSVEGLKPENVVVVDVNGNLLASGTDQGGELNAAASDSHRAAEQAAAADLQRKVQDLLESALGPNRSVVRASVLMDWTERETTSQSFDPETATIRSSALITETYITTGTVTGGIPGAASNLPAQTTSSAYGGGTSEYNRNEQTINYEITQTETKEVAAPGNIQRVSLSVLVDGVDDTGQLTKLQSIIAAAAGIDEARGDQIAVQSLAFDRTSIEQETAEMEKAQKSDLYWRIGEIALSALALAAVLWYIQRLLSNLRMATSQAWTPVLKPVKDVALPAQAAGAPATPAAIPAAVPSETPATSQPAPAPLRLPVKPVEPVLSEEDEQLQRLMVDMAENNPSAVAEIIQMWLNEGSK